MSVISLKAATPARSPARESLALAISAHAEAQREHDALCAACAWEGRASIAVQDARSAIAKAEEGLELAKADTADHLTASALGVSASPAHSIKAARSAIADAEDTLEAARIAKARLEGMIPNAESNLRIRAHVLRARALDVLKEEVGPWQGEYFARVQRQKRELDALTQAVDWLLREGVFSRAGLDSRHVGEHGSAADVWDREIAALMANPDAPTPIADNT